MTIILIFLNFNEIIPVINNIVIFSLYKIFTKLNNNLTKLEQYLKL